MMVYIEFSLRIEIETPYTLRQSEVANIIQKWQTSIGSGKHQLEV